MRAFPEAVELELGLDEPDDEASLRVRAARKLGLDPSALPPLALVRRALDARRGRVRFHVTLAPRPSQPRELGLPEPREVDARGRVLIVGDGPAGLFCAYELARAGISAIVLDRGKPVQPRRHDLKGLNQDGRVDPDSNYCYGEGGAGTYSDGKLYTRADKRGDVRDVLEILVRHGAPDAILTDARPHIGSNKLPKVISGMREHLERCGVQFRFGHKVVGLERSAGGRVAGVCVVGVREAAHSHEGAESTERPAEGWAPDGSAGGAGRARALPGHHAEAVVLATGHSARDVLTMLEQLGVRLQPKGFALGVRIEHPQPLIDGIQYGRSAGHPKLPAAAYRLTHTEHGRGVFSFCMCPGGFIVPAATEPEGLVLNGMSLSKRSSRFANSGLVVGIEPEDVVAAGFAGPLGGVELQRRIERAAMLAGGSTLAAPATRVPDFLRGRGSSSVPRSSYQPGLIATDVAEVLDAAGLRLSVRLRAALERFTRQMPGYGSEEAVLAGVESRTSSPVRVPRDPHTLECLDLPGLYPAGEGAGYAGGIVSAALDGMRVARALVLALASR